MTEKTTTEKAFSYKLMLLKGIKYFVLFLLPVLVDKFLIEFPWIAQMTIGGVLVMILNFLKNKVNLNII